MKPLFASSFWAGFECTSARVSPHRRLDLLKATKHDIYCEDDYQLIEQLGISTVREGLAWSQIDKKGHYNFDRYTKMMKAGQRLSMQQIWDLNHFDYPDDVDPFANEFIDRFALYSRAAYKQIRKFQNPPIIITPINEISFFAWIAADQGAWAPHLKGSRNGLAFKKQLVRAALAAMDVIWKEDKSVRFLHVDPFMRRVPKTPVTKKVLNHVNDFNNIVRYEAWDMLAGKRYPELGGGDKYLDIIGMNYYMHNQEWVMGDGRGIKHRMIDWMHKDRVAFSSMIEDVYKRYGRPIVISETGSYGEHRLQWWKRFTEQIDNAKNQKLPVLGVCAYPILDRPDNTGYLQPQSGLWDFDQKDLEYKRIPLEELLSLLKAWNSSPKIRT